MILRQLTVKEALHKLKRKGLPYKYDLNVYRGCSHGCKYCYATSSHKYLGSTPNSFDREIYAKTNIAEVLDKELGSPKWDKSVINLGGVCDSYQPAEKKCRLMREVLQVLIKHKNPIIISTKSNLILRDLDLIDELSNCTHVNVAICITSCNNDVSSHVEPGASLPLKRYRTLCELGRTKARRGLHVMPILPFLADDNESLETLVRWAHKAKADYMLTGILYMTGGIKNRYMSFIKEKYPKLYKPYLNLYPKGGALKDYKSQVHTFLATMREKYGVSSSYRQCFEQKKNVNDRKSLKELRQMTIFPL